MVQFIRAVSENKDILLNLDHVVSFVPTLDGAFHIARGADGSSLGRALADDVERFESTLLPAPLGAYGLVVSGSIDDETGNGDFIAFNHWIEKQTIYAWRLYPEGHVDPVFLEPVSAKSVVLLPQPDGKYRSTDGDEHDSEKQAIKYAARIIKQTWERELGLSRSVPSVPNENSP